MSIPDPVSVSRAVQPSRRAVSAHEEAAALSQQLLDASRQQGTANMELLARDVARLAELAPDRASHVLAGVTLALDPHGQRRLLGMGAWSQATFTLGGNGKFSLQFGFDDVSDLGRASERRDCWMEEHLEPGAQVIRS